MRRWSYQDLLRIKGVRNNKKNLYHAVKKEVDGIIFDSTLESKRYMYLKMMQSCGEISDLNMQVKYVLQEGFTVRGRRHRPITYKADFTYLQNGVLVIEDAKGKELPIFRMKMKMLIKSLGENICGKPYIFRISKSAGNGKFKEIDY